MTHSDALFLNAKRLTYRRRCSWRRYFWQILVPVLVMFVLPIIPHVPPWLIPACAMCFAVISVWWGWNQFGELRTTRQLWQYIDNRNPPFRLVLAAGAYTSDYTTQKLIAIECHDSHLAGDCPLCGAQ